MFKNEQNLKIIAPEQQDFGIHSTEEFALIEAYRRTDDRKRDLILRFAERLTQ